MTRKRIAIILAGVLGVAAATLVLTGVLHGLDGKAQAEPGPYPPTEQRPTWSIQSGGPSSKPAGPFNPADILHNPGAPAVCVQCANLGLRGCAPQPAPYDEMDALTYGADFGAYDSSVGYLGFSVDALSSGQAGTAVNVEASCTTPPDPAPEPEADEFTTQLDGNNSQFFDGNGVACGTNAGAPMGLVELPASDDLDALGEKDCPEVNPDGGFPNRYVYFSLGPGSPTLRGFDNQAGTQDDLFPADVLVTMGGFPSVYANRGQLGLTAADDVNGLCLADTGMDDYFNPAADYLFYTVTRISPSIPGVVPNAATIMYVSPAGPVVVDTATALGLLENNTDDVDAIKCVKGLVDISIQPFTITLPDGGTAPPETEVTLTVSEWSDFSMNEVKLYTPVNGELSPPSVTSQVGWAVIGSYPGQLNVRFNAQPGDICTDDTGAPVPCGEGGVAGVPWNPQSLPYPPPAGVDSCKDGLDNDQDGLTDFDDPDCVDIYDAHFQINLDARVSTAIAREVQFHCKEAGRFDVTFENIELPLGANDISGGNNAGYIDLTIICEEPQVPQANKQVNDVLLDAASGDPPQSGPELNLLSRDEATRTSNYEYATTDPDFKYLKSTNVPVSVTSLDENLGPDIPADAYVSFLADVPVGCEGRWLPQTSPTGATDILTTGDEFTNPSDPMTQTGGTIIDPQDPLYDEKIDGTTQSNWIESDLHFHTADWDITEPLYQPIPLLRFFEFHCWQAGDFTFTFYNKIEPTAVDIDLTNNWWKATLLVHSLHNADIEILSWTAETPPTGDVGVPFEIRVDETKHNAGPQAAWSDVTWTAVEPHGGEVSARWIADPGDTQPSDEVLQFQIDLPLPPPDVDLWRNLELTCNVAGDYTVTLINDEWPIDPVTGARWEDPDPSDNTDTTDVLVDCTLAGQEIKWVQRPDASPNGLDVAAWDPFILADDFQCTESGLITQIDFWASWYHDELPQGGPAAVTFTLSLHSDVPAGEDLQWSHPGETLWYHTFGPGECMPQLFMGQLQEGYFQPPEYYEFPADTQIWLYSCPIPAPDWFQQKEGVIYWLDVQAYPGTIGTLFGWKTSSEHWNDDGVWAQGTEPEPLSWSELRYPFDHDLYPASIDLAFELWGQPCTAGVDTDFDGFNDDVECYVTTDFRDDCTENPGDVDAWPLDINVDTYVTVVGDVLPYRGRIGETGGPPASLSWQIRLDLNMDNFITVVGDVLMFRGSIGSHCPLP